MTHGLSVPPGTSELFPWPDPITREVFPTLPDAFVAGDIYKLPE
jgi:hypothetical protein